MICLRLQLQCSRSDIRVQVTGLNLQLLQPRLLPPPLHPACLEAKRAARGRLMPCQRFTPAIWAVSVLMNHLAKASLLWKIYWKHIGQILILKQQVEESRRGWGGRWRICGKKKGVRKWGVDEYGAIELVGGLDNVVVVQVTRSSSELL